MRWFGGCAPGGRQVTPVGARLLWSGPALWVMGAWSADLVRTAKGRNARLAVLGPCSAADEELARALDTRDFARAVGDWAGSYIAVRLTGHRAVEVVTDAAGACPLYTVTTPDGVVWASSSRALSALVGGRVDDDWLASYLWDAKAPVPGRSAWADVTPIPAGHRLTLDADAVRSSVWWSPVTRRQDEALPAIRHALTEGVRVRVRDMPSSTDLGGMDSTTLAVIAARCRPLTAVTAHPSGITEGGDLRYARALDVPGLTRIEFPLEEHHLPFSVADTPLPAVDEPPPSNAVWAMLSAQLRITAAMGAVRHLTGDGGDDLFLPSPRHLVDLARSRRWLRLTADALAWARLRRQDPRSLITAALRGDMQAVARPWLTRPAWLSSAVPPPMWRREDADAALITSVRHAARTAHADTQLADALGVELHNPYLDGAVLDAVVSVPAHLRFSVHRYKPLLVDSCGDLLPVPHRSRTTKGVFTADFHRGMRANLRRVLELANGRVVARGLVDPAPLRATVHAAALGAETVWATLLPALAAEAWLDSIEREPAIRWWSPTPADTR
ncbi:albusnodin/ikarugamycin family macrolactam cyclase [Streptomyces iconiensis]|uniref:asparagine synthase (glutamine-hydrolyzing) n=1 Tax=Streptomyces iconiensis TaxID=1384038 RepID=A0ABT6ZWU5_9ACTN|nr:albusnodin/ikarugamycin family macrolactam cyclase [Streptomyces iconiensis]MDJ1133549.1 albusnodin/ikarugamycin family macrolactam cyclase [Streptomyces iconiensis]